MKMPNDPAAESKASSEGIRDHKTHAGEQDQESEEGSPFSWVVGRQQAPEVARR